MVERQLSVLVLRTQVMLSLSGIVITVTGFSGRAIAQTSEPGALVDRVRHPGGAGVGGSGHLGRLAAVTG